MVDLTYALVFVGGLQLLVFGYQAFKLRQTVTDSKEAIAAAQRSAKAAEDAIAASDKSVVAAQANADREHRPYVFMETREFPKIWLKDTKIVHTLRIRITWKNMGNTPARKVTGVVTARAFDNEPPDDFDFTPWKEDNSAGSLGPGATFVTWFQLSMEHIHPYESAERKVFYWAEVTYEGISGAKHWTRVHGQLVPDGPISDPDFAIQDAFMPRFNGDDA